MGYDFGAPWSPPPPRLRFLALLLPLLVQGLNASIDGGLVAVIFDQLILSLHQVHKDLEVLGVHIDTLVRDEIEHLCERWTNMKECERGGRGAARGQRTRAGTCRP